MCKRKISHIKILVFFILLIANIMLYYLTCPKNQAYEKACIHNFITMLYLVIINIAIIFIDFTKIEKKDWIIAGICGTLSITAILPIHLLGVLSGICTFFSYLLSKNICCKGKELQILKSLKFKDILKDICIIMLISLIYIVLIWLSKVDSGIKINFRLSYIFNALSVSISEEIIFRMLVFSIILFIYNNDEPPILITYLILLVPFSVLHYIDAAISNGFVSIIPSALVKCVYVLPIVILAVKRNLFTAIGVHFMLDLISFTISN